MALLMQVSSPDHDFSGVIRCVSPNNGESLDTETILDSYHYLKDQAVITGLTKDLMSSAFYITKTEESKSAR
jgi:hypothetical protein